MGSIGVLRHIARPDEKVSPMQTDARRRQRNVAVLLAGGTGERMGLNIPKQLLKIAGRPILEHSL
ncbi:MAG: NTP transferase domain-containing protein, partial [Marmoricola sp.]